MQNAFGENGAMFNQEKKKWARAIAHAHPKNLAT